ncbi:MAG: hypothetical protein RLZZ423_6 [Cyanobacteriota bacterium]
MTSPGESTATGRRLGLQLRQWLATEPERLRSGTAIANRLIDALGADDSLRGPIRDLSSRPQLLQALHSRGASQQAAVAGLSQQLAQTYAPVVLEQLLALLDAATGLEQMGQQTPPPAFASRRQTRDGPGPEVVGTAGGGMNIPGWQPLLHALAPGIALAASAALVFCWLAQELDRGLFDGWGWSGGVVLVLVLGLLQALAIGPLRRLRRHWSLNDRQAIQPRHAWRWVGASWIHVNGLEASLNLVLLLILLGASPLPLAQVILRYDLTALACLIPAVVLAQRFGVRRRWSGAGGPVGALIGLAAGLSLLHWRVMTFAMPLFPIPAWVLLLVVGALQLSWQLPRQGGDQTSRPWQRLLCSSWTWGLLLGLVWALISRVRELL